MESLLTTTTIVFCLAVFICTYFMRKIIEALLPPIRKDTPLTKSQKVWEEYVLPALPIAIGVLLALLVTSWPWPPGIAGKGSRAVAGAVYGFVSTWVYRIAYAFVTKKHSVDLTAAMEEPSLDMVKAKLKEVAGEAPPPPPVP